MSALQLLIFWIAYTGLMAWAQGWLMYAVRKVPKGSKEANRQEFALHWLFGAVWFLPVALEPSWLNALIAFTVRFALFDVFVNIAAGDKAFHVGRTARTDKLLQLVAAKMRVPVSVLSAVLKLAAIAFLVVFLWKNNS